MMVQETIPTFPIGGIFRFSVGSALGSILCISPVHAHSAQGPAGSPDPQIQSASLNAADEGIAAKSPAISELRRDADSQEIVVTAQRRAESLQTVPISIEAISQTQLLRQSVMNTVALTQLAPTLSFTGGASLAETSFSLRGVSSVAIAAGVQSSTSLVIDDVPVVRPGEFIAELADIAQIEILNGPQGTLFGKNSTAGVINITTKRPVNKLEGLIEGGVTTDGEYALKGIVNTPLSDDIRVRIAAFHRVQRPLIKNISGPDVAGSKVSGVEGKILFDLSEDTDLLIYGGYSHSRSTYPAIFLEIPNALQQQVIGYVPDIDHPRINQDGPSLDIAKAGHIAAQINWAISDRAHLVSITSYRSFKAYNDVENDLTPIGVIRGQGITPNPTGYPLLHVGTSPHRFSDKSSYYSQEIRLNYDNGPLKAVFGAFYQDLKNPYYQEIPFLFVAGPAPAQTGEGYSYSNNITQATFRDRTASAFADLTYSLSPAIKIFGGARYTHEREKVPDYHRETFFNPVVGFFNPVTAVNSAPPVATISFSSRKTIDNLSGRAGIQWQPSQDLNIYFSYARGYKGPGADLSSSASPNHATVDPEIADAFELGAKLRLLDRRLSFNLALFDQKIKGIQAARLTPGSGPGGVPELGLINAGDLRTRGAEASANLAVSDQIRLSAGLAYIDAAYRDFSYQCNAIQIPGTGKCQLDPATGTFMQDLDGSQAVGSPRWKYNVNLSYDGDRTASGLRFFGQIGWNWQSRVIYSLDQNPYTVQRPYGLLNMSVGLTALDERLDVILSVRNLTDRFHYANIISFPNFLGFRTGQVNREFARYANMTVRLHL